MNKQSVLLLFAIFLFETGFGQGVKKPVDFTLYDSWKSLSSQQLSDDGNWVIWSVKPQNGDGQLFLRGWGELSDKIVFNRGTQPSFSPKSDFLAFKVVPQNDSVRKFKVDKVKPDNMPKDTLGIYLLKSGQLTMYPNVKSFKVADESSEWIAFQMEENKADLKPEKKDTTSEGKKSASKSKKKPEFNGLPLVVMNPITHDSINFQMVTDFGFSKNGKWLYMVSIVEDSVKTSTVRVFDTQKGTSKEIWEQIGVVKSMTCDEKATQLAFLFSTDTSKVKNYSLYYWSEKDAKPEMIVDSLTPGMASGMSVSENSRVGFSPDGHRLFFGTAKKHLIEKEAKDTLLADDKVSVDIWHWQEDVLQSIQLKRVEQERKKSYQAVYNIKKNQMVQLGDSLFIESYRLVKQGDSDVAVGFFDAPYALDNSVNYKETKDIYLMDLASGSTERLFEKVGFGPQLSPLGKYLYWWEPADSSWYCYSIRDKSTINLTHGMSVGFTQVDHDTPDDPGSYGLMGWSDNDESLFLYDQFDIWKMNPEGKKVPVCITGSYGRINKLSIRYLQLDPEEKFIDAKKNYLFTLRHDENKKSGFCRFSIDNPVIDVLKLEDYAFSRPSKAKMADKLIWTRSTIKEFPDLWTSDLNFRDSRKISNANPQQSQYIWADVELVEWNDLNGEKHQGLLYKPENLDPSKKYPMIVYFYERHSDGLHTHYYPRASASTVNPLEYASNGYLVFMPDIHFQIGFPGKSFYNAIMSGILELGTRPYVDMKHLGIQGQSWGGYGTAYMITQTGIFAAASPGAPVSNMTSAYGGIRNESGMVRQFQYEKTQSRIGGTLWDKPEYFIENSPLFFADRITTPCLIRHDDADGAVPFSEGVQLFVALRRLQKPAWLINYNNAPHNLSRQADKKDWSVRMMQFFDFYLKGVPAPEWMTKGVSAVNKKSSELYYWDYTEK